MVWWIVATLCAFFIKGLCGFANTLVFSTILSFGIDNKAISPVELLLGYPTNAILAYRERKSIDFKMCAPLILFLILGSIPGVIFLKNVNADMIKIFFGFVIAAIGIEMLIREYKPKPMKKSKVVFIGIGILSGILCGLYGIGALLGAYLTRVTKNSSAFKANMCFTFLFDNTFRIIVYAVSGILTMEIVKQAIVLLPWMLIGLYLGIFSGKILDDRLIKKIVIILLIISGTVLVINCL